MTAPAIDYGIEMPAPNRGRTRRKNAKYPFADMRPGGSFFIAAVADGTTQLQIAIASAASHWTHNNGLPAGTFATRVVTESGVVGVRCWRVKPATGGAA